MKPLDKLKLNAILFDSTRCIGCRSCEEACDEENASRKRKWSQESVSAFRRPPLGLSGDKWLHLSSHELPLEKGVRRRPFNWDDAPDLAEEGQYAFARHACMHCVEPACENACIVGALIKQENGAVVYNKDKCIGCRYCFVACPFSIPKWEWHEPFPYVKKCTMCNHRKKSGKVTACVESCPGNDDGPALIFGKRYELLYKAEEHIHKNKDRYFPHVFGREELGGTGVLYLIPRSLTPVDLGFPANLSARPMPDYSHGPMSTVPYWIGGFGGMLGGLYWIIKRRDEVMAKERGDKGGGK